jgi:C4-dicarboxylate-specific signal transduction histidine kinase
VRPPLHLWLRRIAALLHNEQSPRVHAERALAECDRRLEEAHHALARVAPLATLGEITASITHEINQPLAAILNNTEAGLSILNTQGAPQELRTILDNLRQDCLRARDIVQRLAGLLRGQDALLKPLAIDNVVTDSASLLRTEFRRRHAHLEVRCDAHAMVLGDAARLEQVMLNLLLNALDATSAGPDSRRRILVQTYLTAQQRAQVDVVDYGSGVPVERLTTIFDSFVTTKPDGMGIGLAVTRSIIQAHGGRVWAANNVDGVGATFSFQLPAVQMH